LLQIWLVSGAQKKVTDAIDAAALASQYLGTGMLSNKEMADLYGNAIIEVLSDTRGLVSESNKLLDPLKKALEYYGASAEEIATWLSGVQGMDEATNKLLDTTYDLSAGSKAAYVGMSEEMRMAIESTKKLTDAQISMGNTVENAYGSMAEALGAAFIAGEEGWKGFGRAGLNAVAAVIEATAMGVDAIISAAVAEAGLGAFWKLPGIPLAMAQSATIHALAGGVRAIPMAEGGSGIVTKPTLFLAGEAGPEPYAFGGANNKRGMGGGNTYNTVVQNIGGSVIAERQVKQLAMSGLAQASRGY